MHTLQVIAHLVSREFRLRYRKAVLGWLWALLVPLLTFGVMAFVFSQVLNVTIKNFPAYLFSGVVFVSLFGSGLASVTRSIVDRPQLTMRVGLKRWLIPVVAVLTDAIDLAVSVPVLIGIAIVTGAGVGPWLAFAPIVIIVLVLLTLGFGLLLCTWNVFYRDVKVFVQILTLIIFYATPTFYSFSSLPEKYRKYLGWSPLTRLLQTWRNVMIDNVAPDWHSFLPSAAFSVVLFIIGLAVFQRRCGVFGDEL